MKYEMVTYRAISWLAKKLEVKSEVGPGRNTMSCKLSRTTWRESKKDMEGWFSEFKQADDSPTDVKCVSTKFEINYISGKVCRLKTCQFENRDAELKKSWEAAVLFYNKVVGHGPRSRFAIIQRKCKVQRTPLTPKSKRTTPDNYKFRYESAGTKWSFKDSGNMTGTYTFLSAAKKQTKTFLYKQQRHYEKEEFGVKRHLLTLRRANGKWLAKQTRKTTISELDGAETFATPKISTKTGMWCNAILRPWKSGLLQTKSNPNKAEPARVISKIGDELREESQYKVQYFTFVKSKARRFNLGDIVQIHGLNNEALALEYNGKIGKVVVQEGGVVVNQTGQYMIELEDKVVAIKPANLRKTTKAEVKSVEEAKKTHQKRIRTMRFRSLLKERREAKNKLENKGSKPTTTKAEVTLAGKIKANGGDLILPGLAAATVSSSPVSEDWSGESIKTWKCTVCGLKTKCGGMSTPAKCTGEAKCGDTWTRVIRNRRRLASRRPIHRLLREIRRAQA